MWYVKLLFVKFAVCRDNMDSLLSALEYCVKQHNQAPSYSHILKMLIGLEDADRLQKGTDAVCVLQCCSTFS